MYKHQFICRLMAVCLICFSVFAHGQNIITTVAGNGTAGYTGDGGAATAAEMYHSTGIIFDGVGNMYIAQQSVPSSVVRKVNSSGIISTFAGNGTEGYSGDGGAATAASLNQPISLAIDAYGNIYIADNGNHVVRMVNTSGVISTFAGNGSVGYSGDGGQATAATFGNYMAASISGLAFDGSGNLYIDDVGNSVVRMVNTSGIISTFAGTGVNGYSGDGGPATAAELARPLSIAVDGSNNVYIGDINTVRIVNTSGIISTFAGVSGSGLGWSGDGVAATIATFYNVSGLAIDGCGNVYISNGANSVIRRVNAFGIINTYAGSGTSGYTGDGGPATAAELHAPGNIYVDNLGQIYFADELANVVRKINNILLTTTISGNDTICSGNSTIISISGGFAGSLITLSPSGDTVTVGIGDTASFSVSPTTTTVYTATVTGADSCAYPVSGSVTITVNNVPSVPAITGTSTVCVGASTALSDATGGGSWISSNTGQATVDGSGNVYGVATGTPTISYSVTNSCGTTVATDNVTVNNVPSTPASITGTASVCVGLTTTLSDATGGGSWSSSNTSVATVDGSGVVTGVASGSVTISYTETNSCGATSVTKSVTVNSVAVITGTTTVCVAASDTLHDATSGGTWSSSSSSLATVDASTGVVHGVAAGSPIITYTVSSTGCLATTTITVNPLPNAGTITGTNNACDHATDTLSDAAGGGTWSSSNTFKATVNSSGVVFAVGVGTINISYTVTNSCGTAYTTFSFTAKGLSSTGCCSPEVCTGRTHTVTGSPSTGTWSWSSPTHCTVSASGDIATVTGLSTTGTDHIYYTVPASSTYCASIDTQAVIVVAVVTASVTGTTSEYVDSNTTLTGTGTGSSFTWSSSNTSIATVSASGVVHGVAAGIDSIFYQSCGYCCTTDTVIFTVNAHRGIAPNNFPGTTPNETAEMKVYPNPTSGIFTIELPEKTDNTVITITNIVGKLIEETTTNDNKINIDISNYPHGIYLLKVISGDRKYIEKIVFD